MSSAILYLAIVVIWAFLLVPRWVRRSHPSLFTGTESAGADTTGESGLAMGTDANLAHSDYDSYSSVASVEPDTAPLGTLTSSQAAEAEPVEETSPSAFSAPSSDDVARRPQTITQPPISRSKILQARRRLLTTLVLLAFAAAACTALKLASGWVCVPPAGMLGMYLLLLREAAIADSENARLRADQAAAARARERERARRAYEEHAAQPSAEIIDISARLNDQLYDQYADATVRAVGD